MAAKEEKPGTATNENDQAGVADTPIALKETEITEPAKMSKAEKKRLRRNQRKENEKDKKRLAKRGRVIDLTANENQVEVSYVFEGGLRKVKPYFYTYQTYVRGRWIGRTVLDVVSSEFRYDNHENYATRLRQGLINVNGRPTGASYVLRNQDTLSSRVHRHEIPVASTPLTVVHEDEDFVVVNKPSTIPVHPCGRFRYNTVTMILSHEMGYKNVRTIHRLDRATSGVLILVKNFAKTQEMAARIKNHDLRKEYVCRVMGEFPASAAESVVASTATDNSVKEVEEDDDDDDETRPHSSSPASILVDAPLLCVSQKIGLNRVDARGKEAQTTFQRLSYNGVSSVVKCIPKTGRTHQIRVHLQYLGFPIMNDRFYNSPPLWGPKNGAGGDFGGKTDEQLLEDAARIHSVYNYLGADLYSELVQKHFGGEKHAEKDKNDPTATNGLTTIHGVPSSKEQNSKDVRDVGNVADFGQSEHHDEQPTKKAKLRDNETTSDLRPNELKTIQAGDDGSAEQQAPSPTVTASAKYHPTCIKLGDDGSAEQQAP